MGEKTGGAGWAGLAPAQRLWLLLRAWLWVRVPSHIGADAEGGPARCRHSVRPGAGLHSLAACPRPAPFTGDDCVCTLGRGPGGRGVALLRAASLCPRLSTGPPQREFISFAVSLSHPLQGDSSTGYKFFLVSSLSHSCCCTRFIYRRTVEAPLSRHPA